MRKNKGVTSMEAFLLILFIAIGGIMIGAGVHFIPVGELLQLWQQLLV